MAQLPGRRDGEFHAALRRGPIQDAAGGSLMEQEVVRRSGCLIGATLHTYLLYYDVAWEKRDGK
jgi:hypothetical protein